MSIKITIPNSSSDVLTFGSSNTPTAAQIAGIDSGSSNGQLALYTTASGTSTERVRVDSSGNVGIGMTPSGDSVLEIYGANSATIYKNSATGTTTADGFFVGMAKGTGIDGYVYNREAGALIFGTSNAERARFDTSGNLLVGTTSTDSGRMCVEAQTNGYAISFRRNTGVYGSNTKVGQISCDGSSTVYTTSSDYRLKENIAPMTGALAKVAQLNPVTYSWKSDGSASQGFIAHELQTVVPDCVVGQKDAVDADGNPKYQGIDTSFLVATLTAAIQELNARLTALENK
jgi:hypothetical protein